MWNARGTTAPEDDTGQRQEPCHPFPLAQLERWLQPERHSDRASAGVTGKQQEGWRVMRRWTTKRPEERHPLWTARVLFLPLLLLALPGGALGRARWARP